MLSGICFFLALVAVWGFFHTLRSYDESLIGNGFMVLALMYIVFGFLTMEDPRMADISKLRVGVHYSTLNEVNCAGLKEFRCREGFRAYLIWSRDLQTPFTVESKTVLPREFIVGMDRRVYEVNITPPNPH